VVVQGPTGSNNTCTTVPAGATGTQVLVARAKALGRTMPRIEGGMICSIDGFPAAGQPCSKTDPHGGYDYWAYYHRAPTAGSWSYSNVGSDSYHPANGSEEGWVYVQGQSEADAPRPPLLPFNTVCPQAAGPATSAAPGAGSGTTPKAPVAGGKAPGSGAGTSAAPTAVAPTRTDAPTEVSSKAAASPTATRPASAGASTGTSTSASQHLAATGAAQPERGGSSGFPVAAVVGIALAAVLAGAAWWRVRSRRDAG
jgi:hypothetical protein